MPAARFRIRRRGPAETGIPATNQVLRIGTAARPHVFLPARDQSRIAPRRDARKPHARCRGRRRVERPDPAKRATAHPRRAVRSRCPLGSPNKSGQPAESFWHDRVGSGGQPSRDGTAKIGNLGTVFTSRRNASIRQHPATGAIPIHQAWWEPGQSRQRRFADTEKRSSTMDDILSIAGASTLPSPKRQMTEEKMIMKAIVVTDQAAGTAGMKLVKRAKPQAAINDVVVQVHASGFVPTELEWPSTWTDRLDRDRTPS